MAISHPIPSHPIVPFHLASEFPLPPLRRSLPVPSASRVLCPFWSPSTLVSPLASPSGREVKGVSGVLLCHPLTAMQMKTEAQL